MKLFTLQRQQIVHGDLESVFPFFERPENLIIITPPSLGFRVLTPSPVPMNQGRIIDYTIRVKGIKLRWRSIITDYEPPHLFSDEQLKGPYSYWRHTHQFEAMGDATKLSDHVTYALPSAIPSPLTDAVNRFFVEPQLKHIFDYRQRKFAELFGTPQPTHTTSKLSKLRAFK